MGRMGGNTKVVAAFLYSEWITKEVRRPERKHRRDSSSSSWEGPGTKEVEEWGGMEQLRLSRRRKPFSSLTRECVDEEEREEKDDVEERLEVV
ncbi:Hypothetical protein FKW44_005411 [Caligus rogercresseyi]|uniref:Uncharacterized protein n=1 Tax=Caligus rogercresseyi TaxID=217165 RepID=A0A7T8KBW8_CALRO|nr:Hypothetical protein FKW44_005411 [Caligus rogercresseyi]